MTAVEPTPPSLAAAMAPGWLTLLTRPRRPTRGRRVRLLSRSAAGRPLRGRHVRLPSDQPPGDHSPPRRLPSVPPPGVHSAAAASGCHQFRRRASTRGRRVRLPPEWLEWSILPPDEDGTHSAADTPGRQISAAAPGCQPSGASSSRVRPALSSPWLKRHVAHVACGLLAPRPRCCCCHGCCCSLIGCEPVHLPEIALW